MALLGAVLTGGGHTGQPLTLHAPLIVSFTGYLIAICLAWVATRRTG